MARKRLLTLEQLERRELPATFGVPWPDADELTLQFVPDGTLIAGRPSELFRTLDAELPTAGWQREILRAFQTWAVTTHINVTVVTEAGSADNPAGPNKPADIRIAALPLSPTTLAIAAPYDPTAGEYAGDVLLNSNFTFGVGDTEAYDLYSVFLHEAGHVFGIKGHDDAPEGSIMHEEYEGVKTGLTPWDTEAIEDLYRPRAQDSHDGSKGFKNETFATATRMTLGNPLCEAQESTAKPPSSIPDKKPLGGSSIQSGDKKSLNHPSSGSNDSSGCCSHSMNCNCAFHAGSTSGASDNKPSPSNFGLGNQTKPPSSSVGSTTDGKPPGSFVGFGSQTKPPGSSASPTGDNKASSSFFGFGADKKPEDKTPGQTSDSKSFTSSFSFGSQTKPPASSPGSTTDNKSSGGSFNFGGPAKSPGTSSSSTGGGKSPGGSSSFGGPTKSPGTFSHGFGSSVVHTDFSFLFNDKNSQGKSSKQAGDNKSPTGSSGFTSPPKSSSNASGSANDHKSPTGFAGFGGPSKSPGSSSGSTNDNKSSTGSFGPGSDKKPPGGTFGPAGDGKSSNGFFGFGNDKKPSSCGSTLVKPGPLAEISGDLTTGTDVDVYRFDVGQGVGEATIRLRTSGSGLLTPRLTVYNASHQIIDTVFADHPIHEDLAIPLGKVAPGTTLYVEVAGASDDVFDVGPYRLTVEPDAKADAGSKPKVSGNGFAGSKGPSNGFAGSKGPSGDLPSSALHKNDDFDSAFRLSSQSGWSSRDQEQTAFDWISDSTDVDFYKVKTPKAPRGTPDSLRATVLKFRDDGPNLKVEVYDADHQRVHADVVVSEGGVYTVQTGPVAANANYYVVVSASQPASITGKLNYSLTVSFDANAVSLETFVNGTLGAAGRLDERLLQVEQSEVLNLVLSADAPDAKTPVELSLTFLDEDGRTVLQMNTKTGESVSTKTLLNKGTYTLVLEATVPDGTRLPPVFWMLRGNSLSSPIGPRPEDTTLDVVGSVKTPDAAKATGGWGDVGNQSFVSVQAPASDLGWEGAGPRIAATPEPGQVPPAVAVVTGSLASPVLTDLVPELELLEEVLAVVPESEPAPQPRVDAAPPLETPAVSAEVSLAEPPPPSLPPVALGVMMTGTREFAGLRPEVEPELIPAPQAVAHPFTSDANLPGAVADVRLAAFWGKVEDRTPVVVQTPSGDPGVDVSGSAGQHRLRLVGAPEPGPASVTVTHVAASLPAPRLSTRGQQSQPQSILPAASPQPEEAPPRAPDAVPPANTASEPVNVPALQVIPLVRLGTAPETADLDPPAFDGAPPEIEVELATALPLEEGSSVPGTRSTSLGEQAARLVFVVSTLVVGSVSLGTGGASPLSFGPPSLRRKTTRATPMAA